MTRLKTIGVFSAAKVGAVFMAIVGLAAGILYSFGGAFIDARSGSINTGTALAFLALIGMPFLSAAGGLVAGAILAIIHNLAAKLTGGLAVECETDL